MAILVAHRLDLCSDIRLTCFEQNNLFSNNPVSLGCCKSVQHLVVKAPRLVSPVWNTSIYVRYDSVLCPATGVNCKTSQSCVVFARAK